ncbi:MAG: hypothetical protein ACKO6K_04510, partial [Chitinophagaceae bacterium]
MKQSRAYLAALLFLIGAQVNGQTITTGSISGSPFCPGQTNVNVPYTASGTFSNNNVFRAQLSNATGSFASPTVIGSLTSKISGTINATIPASAVAGTGYRIRVISTNPAATGSDNGSNLTIYSTATCGSNWTTTGNAGINSTNNFIGTLGSVTLVFKVNNVQSGLISSAPSISNNAGANTAFGYSSLTATTSGFSNTAIGAYSLSLNTTGQENVAIG